ncbi:MAG: hypothetical protein AB8F74_15150, partial [Saprospiraceae bacterium]
MRPTQKELSVIARVRVVINQVLLLVAFLFAINTVTANKVHDFHQETSVPGKDSLALGASAIPTENNAIDNKGFLCLEASNNGPLCVGQTLELYATDGADSYLWTGPNGFTSTEQNPVIPNAGIESDSFFTVTAIGGPCPGTVNTPAFIKVSLDGTAQSNSPVCLGDNIELSSFGGLSFSWSGPSNYSSNDDDPTILNAELEDAGIYTVILTAGICMDTISVEVEVLPDFLVTTNISPADCDEDGAIDLEVNGGTPPYSYDWSDLPGNDNPEDRTDLTVGSYDVTIYDDTGCGAPFNNLIIGDFCNCGADAGNISADESSVCLDNGTATISAIPDGNQSVPTDFEVIYVLTEGDDLIIVDVSADPSFIVSAKGDYTIHTLTYDPTTLDLSIVQLGTTSATTVVSLILQGGGDICAALDVNGAPIVVSGVSAMVNTISPAACDLCNGFVVLAPSNNTYTWSDGGTGASRNDLCADFYNITVTDNNGCSSELNLTIADDCINCEDINVLNIVAIETSCGNSTGSILIELDNPANYSYDWSPNTGTSNANDNGRTNLASGVYTVEVTDLQDLDCSATFLISVGISDGPVVEGVSSTPSSCSAADGSITILPANYEYVWVADGFIGNSRSDLTSGPHDVIVTDPSNPDCPDIITVQVGEVNDLSAEAIINNSPTCDEANGTVTINLLSGGGSNMTYQWNNGGDNVTENNLAAGPYGVFITNEDTGCTFNLIFGLADDVGTVGVVVDPFYEVSCVGSTDAEITFELNPSDDFVGPATVLITDAAGNTFNNGQLGPGQYCVIANDANGCVAGTGCVNVVQPAALDVDVTLTAADCQTGGTINVLTFGGNPNYTYDWADLPGADNDKDRNDLAPGTYNLTVTDNNGCSAIADNLVIANDCGDCLTPPVVNSIVVVDSNCDQADGQAIINMTTNFADFTYEWTPDLGTPNAIGNSRSNLPAGSYSVLIRDINDPACFIEETINIGNTDGPQVDIESTTASSCSVSNGSAILTTLPGLTYVWSDGGFGAERFDLAAGEYQVTVTDVATGCFTIVTVEIGIIDEIEVALNVITQPDCNEANGSISVEVNGGSGSYFYSWGPTTTLVNLAAGPYEITVTDLTTGCTGEAIAVLTDDVVGADIEFQETIETTCPGSADGFNDFAFLPEPGFVGPPSTSIVDAAGNTFTNGQLPEGEYCIIIEDANGCLAASACFEVVSAGQIDIDISITPVTCNALGSIDLEVLGTNGPYIYNWSDVAGNNNPPDRFGLTVGLYSVTITDGFGCEVVADDLIVADDCTITPDCIEPVVTNLTTVEATCGDNNGSTTISLSGNEATDYTYNWSPNISTSNTATNLPSGVYSVTIANVTDENCTTEVSFSIQNSDGPQADIISSTPATCAQANGTAVASPPNFIYEWCSGTIGFNGLDLPAGTCFVTVTDPVTNCTNILEVEIEELNTLDAEIVIDNNPDCGADNGVASVLVTGGSANYSYAWSDGGSGSIRNDLEAGAYTVTVTDLGATGCEVVLTFDLINDLDIDQQATIMFGGNGTGDGLVSCAGSADGFIDVNISPGPDFAGEAISVIVDADGNTY